MTLVFVHMCTQPYLLFLLTVANQVNRSFQDKVQQVRVVCVTVCAHARACVCALCRAEAWLVVRGIGSGDFGDFGGLRESGYSSYRIVLRCGAAGRWRTCLLR